MGKGKTFGGLGIGVVLSTIATVFIAKKRSDLMNVVQKNSGSFSGLLKSLASCVIGHNKKEVT
jgi:hypothetical protein